MQRRAYTVHKGAYDKQLWCFDVRLCRMCGHWII